MPRRTSKSGRPALGCIDADRSDKKLHWKRSPRPTQCIVSFRFWKSFLSSRSQGSEAELSAINIIFLTLFWAYSFAGEKRIFTTSKYVLVHEQRFQSKIHVHWRNVHFFLLSYLVLASQKKRCTPKAACWTRKMKRRKNLLFGGRWVSWQKINSLTPEGLPRGRKSLERALRCPTSTATGRSWTWRRRSPTTPPSPNSVSWVANKRFEISKFKFKIPRARTSELQGSFSAVSKPNFTSKYSLESSRRDL